MENSSQPSLVLSDEDCLKLQQLLTLQALIAQSQSSESKPKAGDETGVEEDSDSHVNIDKWRLVPEDVQLHEWQTNCLSKWLPIGKGTVKVATGGGKTLFALYAAQELQNTTVPDLRLAVVVPNIALMNQWFDELTHSNIPLDKIALMGGGNSVPDDPDLRILICVLDSARERLPGKIKDFGWSSQLLLVVDECHRANAPEAKKIFEARPKYTLGLSATPEPGDEDSTIPADEAYEQSPVGKGLGPIIFEFTLKQSLDAGLLTPFEVWHIGLPLNSEEDDQHAKLSREISELRKELQAIHSKSNSKMAFIAWANAKAKENGDAARFIGLTGERKRLIYRATSRSELTLGILSASMREADHRAIVFHEVIEDISQMYIVAVDKGIPAVLEHSKLPSSVRAGNIDAFRRGAARTIISARSLVEGFNVPSADLGIIAASSGSVRQRIQSLGRMLRKKESGAKAVIFVFYIRKTEDEAIYQKADWESVIGAEQNRYFVWDPTPGGDSSSYSLNELTGSFVETGKPPRRYRPPCTSIEDNTLVFDCDYPAQTTGSELKVDRAGNLRPTSDDKSLVDVPREAVDRILEVNQYRRATLTPCGHLICRAPDNEDSEQVWIYLGNAVPPEVKPDEKVEKLKIKSSSGRREIVRKHGRDELNARGAEKAEFEDAGRTRDMLLDWIGVQEKKLSTSIQNLYWNSKTEYWIEVDGKRYEFKGTAPLEFRNEVHS